MNSRPKLSPWFPFGVRPTLPGVYETKLRGERGSSFSRWNGHTWFCSCISVDAAAREFVCVRNEKRWRGLAEPPK